MVRVVFTLLLIWGFVPYQYCFPQKGKKSITMKFTHCCDHHKILSKDYDYVSEITSIKVGNDTKRDISNGGEQNSREEKQLDLLGFPVGFGQKK